MPSIFMDFHSSQSVEIQTFSLRPAFELKAEDTGLNLQPREGPLILKPTFTPTNLSITLEGSVFARSTVVQTISPYDYALGVWEVVDTRNASRFSDRVDTIELGGDLSRFVELGTHCMKARVLYKSNVARQQFTSNTDRFSWTLER